MKKRETSWLLEICLRTLMLSHRYSTTSAQSIWTACQSIACYPNSLPLNHLSLNHLSLKLFAIQTTCCHSNLRYVRTTCSSSHVFLYFLPFFFVDELLLLQGITLSLGISISQLTSRVICFVFKNPVYTYKSHSYLILMFIWKSIN
jgi:hypothetical protein